MKEYRVIKTVCFTILVIMVIVLVSVGMYSGIHLLSKGVAGLATLNVDASNQGTLVIIEGSGLSDSKVVYDRDTKVLYYYVYKGGLFPLYNADGSLKLYEGE